MKIYFKGEEPVIVEGGDWIDLRASQDYEYSQGDSFLVDLGISMQLPKGYEGHLAPRGSTFKNYGLIQTNSVGVIDESYSGDEDIWKMPVYALRDGKIEKGDRICQFRIVEKQPLIKFCRTTTEMKENRGGFGSTGK